jgi:hypothetical protein
LLQSRVDRLAGPNGFSSICARSARFSAAELLSLILVSQLPRGFKNDNSATALIRATDQGGIDMLYRAIGIGLLALCAACVPKSELEGAQTQIARLQTENAQLRDQLAERSALPVKVAFRKALLGPGLVAIFETTIKNSVSVLVTIQSASLGTTKTVELHLDPAGTKEIGHQEGVVFETGDTLILENKDYSARTLTVPSVA